jgi:hypothetical protein
VAASPVAESSESRLVQTRGSSPSPGYEIGACSSESCLRHSPHQALGFELEIGIQSRDGRNRGYAVPSRWELLTSGRTPTRMPPCLRQLLRSTAILALAAWTLLCCCEKRLLAAWIAPATDSLITADVNSPASTNLGPCCCCATENSAASAAGTAEPASRASDATDLPLESHSPCGGDDPSGGEGDCQDSPRHHPRGCCTACCVKFCEPPSRVLVSLDDVEHGALKVHRALEWSDALLRLCIALDRAELSASPPPRPPGLGLGCPRGLPSTILVSARWRV